MSKFHFVIFFLMLPGMLPTASWARSRQQPTFVAQSRESTPAAAEKNQNSQAGELASDLQRMQVLVNQMQTNLGFVQNLNTPLRHQFELEIQMWQVLVGQMERRLESMGAKPAH